MGKWRDWESRREQRKPANVEEQAEPLDRALSFFYLHRRDGLGRLDGLAHNACQPGGQQQEKGDGQHGEGAPQQHRPLAQKAAVQPLDGAVLSGRLGGRRGH